MFLGTSRGWWIAAGVCFLLGLFLITGDLGGALGNVLGILLIFAAIMVFAAAPMRYGRKPPQAAPAAEEAPAVVPLHVNEPPSPRPSIEARDARDV